MSDGTKWSCECPRQRFVGQHELEATRERLRDETWNFGTGDPKRYRAIRWTLEDWEERHRINWEKRNEH